MRSTPSLAPPAAAPPTADVQKYAQPTATQNSLGTEPRVAPPPAPSSAPPAPQTPFAALKLEMVVNADDPAERAVYISGRRYVTGESLERGAMIESIAPDAVVLRWAGQRYLLRWEHPPTPLGR